MAGKLVAVFAHPDDETFICGGTLAKVARDGNEVVLICATKGEMGRRMGMPATETRETISAIRETELQSACRALGIRWIHFLGLRDKTLEIQPFEVLKNSVLRHMHCERPDTVLTFHEKWGGHADHCAIGAAATAAFLEYHSEMPDAKLLFVCSGDMIRNPEHYGLRAEQLLGVDVSGCLLEKLRAYRAHRTQSQINEWLWEDDQVSASKLWSVEYLIDWRSLPSN